MRQALRTGMGGDSGAPSAFLVNLGSERSDRSIESETMLPSAYEISTIFIRSTRHLLSVYRFRLATTGTKYDCPQQEHDER